jgi:GT2 family glycosyltransferase
MIGAAREAARKLSDTPLTQAERAILNTALSRFQDSARRSGEYTRLQSAPPTARIPRRIEILIPIYKDIAITKACIESVLHARCPETDRILLFNDASPEPGMASMLEQFAGLPNVVVMTNESNLGFVRTVNGGLRFLRDGDVLLLNSDTIVYPGGIGELWRAAHASPSIGTATALSNNATIFSYPHPQLPAPELDDVSWEELAAFALVENAGCSVDVPTANGFCMLIKREVLDRLGGFDEAFCRGYGEENDFCFRAFGLGYRHIAAAGAFVQHLDSVSFGAEKASLMSGNLGLLNSKYPEYTPIVMAFEAADPLRRARWALDAFRLRRLVAAGTRFTLVVQTWLRGGTRKAIADIEQAAGGGSKILRLTARENGMLELTAAGLKLRAVFQDSELDSLFNFLADAQVSLAVVHQLLGYGAGFIRRLTRFAAARHAVAFVHALLEIGNVCITGEYRPEDLPLLLDKTDAGIALFLHGWPETFSYTLTEAVMQGLLPLVPDIGAPADRVRASGIGAVFPFPASPAEILTAIGDLQAAGPAPITQAAFARFTGVTAPADIARLLAPQDADAELCLEVGRAN